jgi:predicted acylesterase/phospholipase RssA
MWVHSLSFSGANLNGAYQLGAANELIRCNVKTNKVVCTSAGMIAALYYLLKLNRYVSIDTLLKVLPIHCDKPQIENSTATFMNGVLTGKFCPNLLEESRKCMIDEMRRILYKYVPNAYKRVSGKLFVTICEWPRMNTAIVNCWKSNEELLTTLSLTTAIPYVTTPGALKWKGKCWVDGGFRDSHPIFCSQTIVITNSKYGWTSYAMKCKGCRWGEISRSTCIDSTYLVPSRAYYKNLYLYGKRDARAFLKDCC